MPYLTKAPTIFYADTLNEETYPDHRIPHGISFFALDKPAVASFPALGLDKVWPLNDEAIYQGAEEFSRER